MLTIKLSRPILTTSIIELKCKVEKEVIDFQVESRDLVKTTTTITTITLVK
jgi:hypothetical protein